MVEPTNESTQREPKTTSEIYRDFQSGKQRYLEAVGNNQGYLAGVRGKDYLLDEAREEAKQLLRQMLEKSSQQRQNRHNPNILRTD